MAEKRTRARPKGHQSLPAELIGIIFDGPIGQTINDKLRQIMGLPKPDTSAKMRTEAKGAAEKIKSKMDENSPYKVLGVDPGAEEQVVKAAYKAKAKLFHPDPPGGGSNRKMAEINQAYERILKAKGWKR